MQKKLFLLLLLAVFSFSTSAAQASGIPVVDAAANATALQNYLLKVIEWSKTEGWQGGMLANSADQLRRAQDMVEQGNKGLRVSGDPAALVGALKFDSVADTLSSVQAAVKGGRAIYKKGYSLYTLGESTFESSQSGDMQGVLNVAGLGKWGRLGNLNNPEDIVRYANSVNFQGHGVLRQNYEGIQKWEDAVDPQKKQLMDDINRVVGRLGQAQSDAEIQLLMSQLEGLQTQAIRMGDESLAIYLKQLVEGDAWRTAQDAQERANISGMARIRLDNYKADLLEAAQRQEAFMGRNQQRPVGESLRDMDLTNPSRDNNSASSQFDELQGGTSQNAWKYIESRQASKGMCLRGANNVLLSYLGRPTMDQAGLAYAKDSGPLLQERFGMSAVADTGSYRNGDTRVLQPSNSSQAGHIEVFMDGRWVSDHVQSGSYSSNRDRYGSAQLYRLAS